MVGQKTVVGCPLASAVLRGMQEAPNQRSDNLHRHSGWDGSRWRRKEDLLFFGKYSSLLCGPCLLTFSRSNAYLRCTAGVLHVLLSCGVAV